MDLYQGDALGVVEVQVCVAAADMGYGHHVFAPAEGLPELGDGVPVGGLVGSVLDEPVVAPVEVALVAQEVDVVVAPGRGEA